MVQVASLQADVVIVGAGHAGVQLVSALAKHGYAGSVIVISDEAVLPYERPPLSKGYLKGTESREALELRDARYWTDGPARLLLGTRAQAIEPGARTLHLDDGRQVAYGDLVWAAGGRARRLPIPGAELDGVHYIRTLEDADAILDAARDAKHAAIIGGGYIGLEAAASLRSLGLEVVVLEAAPRLLARVTSEPVSAYFKRLHENNGVEVRLDTVAEAIIGKAGKVAGVALAGGAHIPTDLVIAGIGLVPCVDVLEAAGCEVADGVVVDAQLRTTLPHVYSIGDCTRWTSAHAGGPVRIESIPNATEHAQILAATLSGGAPPVPTVPWFWSDQYTVKLKTAGLMAGHDRMLVRGAVEDGAFSVGYLKDGRLVALDAINSTPDFAQAKALIAQGAQIDPDRFRDPGAKLRNTVIA